MEVPPLDLSFVDSWVCWVIIVVFVANRFAVQTDPIYGLLIANLLPTVQRHVFAVPWCWLHLISPSPSRLTGIQVCKELEQRCYKTMQRTSATWFATSQRSTSSISLGIPPWRRRHWPCSFSYSTLRCMWGPVRCQSWCTSTTTHGCSSTECINTTKD